MIGLSFESPVSSFLINLIEVIPFIYKIKLNKNREYTCDPAKAKILFVPPKLVSNVGGMLPDE